MMEYHLITQYDPATETWSPTKLHEGNPLAQVRKLLGGRWTDSEGHLQEDMAAGFWNAVNRRKVFVIRLPRGLPRDAALRVAES